LKLVKIADKAIFTPDAPFSLREKG